MKKLNELLKAMDIPCDVKETTAVFVLVNQELHEKLIEKGPCLCNMDLAMICNIVFRNKYNKMTYKPILWKHINQSGVDVNELIKYVYVQSKKSFPADFRKMNDILKGVIDLEERENVFYVLSNKNGLFGASALFYDYEIIEQLARDKACNVICLPSSIHEWILVPESEMVNCVDNIKDVVKSVNDTIVSKDEILSYNVYRFLYEENKFEIFENN